MNPTYSKVGVVGVGAMGRGIAQIAAQAGSVVYLFDRDAKAIDQALAQVRLQWTKLTEKGRMSEQVSAQCSSRLVAARDLAELADCDLVVEAIVERLDAKQALFAQLEAIVKDDATLATNTSSLSVTAMAAGLKSPSRLAGYHFFNPVPLMKVVEVIAGLRTEAVHCDRLRAYAIEMGHTPVSARDTPGFIVNHAGRGYGTEALRVAGEQVAPFAIIDLILREQAGFKLGPFELMDLTALDVSHPVMESIYHQYYEEPRYRPSAITAQRLAGGLLGRKSGEGFYRYGPAGRVDEPVAGRKPAPTVPPVWLSPRAARRAELLQLLKDLSVRVETASAPSADALILVAPLGFDVTTVAAVDHLDPARTVGIDMLIPDVAVRRRVLATNPATREDFRAAAEALFAQDGKPVSVIRDSAGFVTQRVLAAIINIATDMCQQAICTPADLDTAVTLGLGYPQGPLAWGDQLGPASILEVLFNMQTVYGDPRYRPSPWLRRRAALGLSLAHSEA